MMCRKSVDVGLMIVQESRKFNLSMFYKSCQENYFDEKSDPPDIARVMDKLYSLVINKNVVISLSLESKPYIFNMKT